MASVNERIKQASRRARRKMDKLDAKTLKQLEAVYKEALDDIYQLIADYSIDEIVPLSVLNTLKEQITQRLEVLASNQKYLLEGELFNAAVIGVTPMAVVPEIIGAAELISVANDAVIFVQSLAAEDGLILSDRLWRLDRMATETVINQLQNSLLQGHNASEAAQAFLDREIPIPKDIADKLSAVELNNLRASIAETLMTGEGSAYYNARRVFRTELNRAHGEAYHRSVFEHPDAIGTRFLLSPGHPRADICDMHASVNLYGLGAGVYPEGKNPWPAHPNSLSYTEIVFKDEVSEADKKSRQKPFEWIKDQPKALQDAVLGGKGKGQLFRKGKLRERDIKKPLKQIKV